MKNLLMIFAKNPVLGKVKTRLAQTLGDEKALVVYKYLLHYTADITSPLPCDKAVFYAGYLEQDDIWEANTYQKYVQEGDSLGHRMQNAFSKTFAMGYDRIVIIGSDCLELTQAHLQEAFQALDTHDFVLGPARDGGYYLLGMNHLISNIFKNKSWSTASVLQDTLMDLQALNKSYALLSELSDVDYEADISKEDWKKIQDFENNTPGI